MDRLELSHQVGNGSHHKLTGDKMLQVKVNYTELTNISTSANGTVFSHNGQTLWVKLSDTQVMEVGTGRLIDITVSCFAYSVAII